MAYGDLDLAPVSEPCRDHVLGHPTAPRWREDRSTLDGSFPLKRAAHHGCPIPPYVSTMIFQTSEPGIALRSPNDEPASWVHACYNHVGEVLAG